MKLFYRKYGSGLPIIILHGLYGSSDNWISIAKKLETNYEVILPDLRNHGKSPHSPYHNYELMQSDLLTLMDELNLKKAVIIGHSMGGKTAMYFAKNNPEKISNLIIVDISPLSYHNDDAHNQQILLHQNIINALMKMDLHKIKNRQEADIILSKLIDQKNLRNFLLKNLQRNNDGKFNWKLNIPIIEKSLSLLLDGLDPDDSDFPVSGFPVLFIKGELSNYIKSKDWPAIQRIFPAAELKTVSMTGHWLHAEKPDYLINIINDFIQI